MRAPLVAAPLLLVAACSESALILEPPPLLPPRVVAAAKERWYPVTGATVTSIAESLRRNTLEWEREHAYALTTWRVGWGGRSTRHQGICRLVDLQVRVDVDMLMPRWVDGERGTFQALVRWGDFESALRAHEEGHRDIAYRAGIALHGRLEELQDPSCVALAQRARAEATALLGEYRERDRRYDRRTERGRLQGVAW